MSEVIYVCFAFALLRDGLKNSRHFLGKLFPAHDASYMYLFPSSDWFIGLFASVVIGLMTLNYKPLTSLHFLSSTYIIHSLLYSIRACISGYAGTLSFQPNQHSICYNLCKLLATKTRLQSYPTLFVGINLKIYPQALIPY